MRNIPDTKRTYAKAVSGGRRANPRNRKACECRGHVPKMTRRGGQRAPYSRPYRTQ